MPIQLNIVLGANVFHAEGDLTDMQEDLVSMFRTWLNAQNLGPAVTLEQLTEQFRTQNTDMEQFLARHSPPQE